MTSMFKKYDIPSFCYDTNFQMAAIGLGNQFPQGSNWVAGFGPNGRLITNA
jgi:hypothetical protein